ncbi:hypothetical protein [Amycolatopsis jiangsuensis]|uniref:Uncharacterized protein n=1 Tax=Amycolatopsis jiangsuensis TaxID=1181879 RepID=A0A840IMY4_9PSEU|nr:hypothetical protein [Amycolatopsis jiangsuensis]MBB4683310.1 hypothetical protein [Amycolatopsis jiangsuensis]
MRVPTRRRHSPIPRLLLRAGLRGTHLHTMSGAAVGLCVTLWLRAKTVDQDERGNAERRALFVGLWPPTLWLLGDSLERAHGR